MVETLCTEAQALLAIGQNASATQVLAGNTTIWINFAESDMEKVFGDNVGLVANYATITAAHKQWLAMVCSYRAAFHAINQNQNTWSLAVTQSKLNVCDSIWKGFISDMKEPRADIIADLNLSP